MKAIDELPDDPGALKETIAGLMEQIGELFRDNDRLKFQLEKLRRSLFGRKSEKVDVRQLLLFMEEGLAEIGENPDAKPTQDDEDEEDGGTPGRGERKSGKKGHGRNPLPDHLPRERREIPPREEDLTCACCKEPRQKIGESTSLRLDHSPATFTVIEEVRGKYACAKCPESISSPPPPPRPIPKGLPEPGLLAHVLVSKYADHLPLHRQSTIFRRSGVYLSRNTLGDWVKACSDELDPLRGLLREDVFAPGFLNTDDTPLRVLEANGPGVHKGHLWVYVAGGEMGCTVFDFSPNWEGQHPQAFLDGYVGKMQADDYSGYEAIYADGKVIEIACGAHMRRKFFDARSSDPVRAHMALGFFRRLYKVERLCRGSEPERRREIRQRKAKGVLGEFKEWLDKQKPVVRPRSPLGEAIRYALNKWDAFIRYIDDGRAYIDNTIAERALRGVAQGRKAWMFAGSDEGGRRAAVVLSIIATCRQHDVEPYEYLRDVLARLPTHPPDRLRELLPAAWKAAREEKPPDGEGSATSRAEEAGQVAAD